MRTAEHKRTRADIHDEALSANLRYYEENAADFTQRTRALELDAIYAPFLEFVASGGSILDAGCGSGRDCVAFLNKGYRVKAIDASSAMVSEARRLGVDAEVQSFREMTFEAEFDGIWACASLLHVPKSEIVDVLKRFSLALKLKGILFVSLKEGEGEGIAEDGRFFSYFRLGEFCALLEAAGLFVMQAQRSVADDGREWLNFLGKRI